MPVSNDRNDRSATVVHLHGQQPAWMGFAVLGMLSLQFCLLAVIAWRMLGGPSSGLGEGTTNPIAQRTQIENEVFDKILADLKGKEEGYTSSLRQQVEQNRTLQKQLADHRELTDIRGKERDDLTARLAKLEESSAKTKEKLEGDLTKVRESRDKYKTSLASLEKEMAENEKKTPTTAVSGRTLWIVSGGILALVLTVVGMVVVQGKGSSLASPAETDEMHDETDDTLSDEKSGDASSTSETEPSAS